MTLIVGIVCSDGVVLAADSASTDAEAQTKQPYQKIRRLATHRLLYGGSGDGGLLQKIDDALSGCPGRDRIRRWRQELKGRIVPEQREAVQVHAPYPAAGFHAPPVAILLFAGICEGQPFLLEIEKDGRDTVYNAGMGHFAAIGSGKPWAQALFRPYLFTPRDLELGTIFAYRVLEDAIDLASANLARPIHIWRIPVVGEPSQVSEEEMDQKLKNVVNIWRSMEADTVGRLRQQPEPTGPAAEIPTAPTPAGPPAAPPGPTAT